MPLKVIRRPDTGALTISGTVHLPDGSKLRVRQRAQSDRKHVAEEEAAALEARLLREAFHGKKPGGRYFAAAVTSYLKAVPRGAWTAVTLRRVLFALGDVPLAAIDQEVIDGARDKMFVRQVAPATVLRDLNTPVRAVMLHAARRK